MIANDDANGNRVRRSLLAGTGHGGSEGLVTAEFHGDGGVFRTYYDVFGDARKLRNELATSADPIVVQIDADELRNYDAMGRLTQQTHRGGLLPDHYAYDLLGQRTKHWNSHFGIYDVEVTDYDMQGRVTRQVTFGGEAVSTSYAWNGAISTTGLGSFGGWTKSVYRAGVGTNTAQMDVHGRDVSKTDAGGHVTSFGYDKAGRLASQAGFGGQAQSTSYFNTGRAWQIVDTASTGNQITATFGYDSGGYRTYEGYAGTVWAFKHDTGYHSASYQTLQNATIDYDALGRVTAFTDRDASSNVRITYTNLYDLAGNVRRTTSSFPNIAYPQYGNQGADYWFAYDGVNRMTVANGELSGGAVTQGAGSSIAYDAAGRRSSATQQVALTGYAEVWVADTPGGGGTPRLLFENCRRGQ